MSEENQIEDAETIEETTEDQEVNPVDELRARIEQLRIALQLVYDHLEVKIAEEPPQPKRLKLVPRD